MFLPLLNSQVISVFNVFFSLSFFFSPAHKKWFVCISNWKVCCFFFVCCRMANVFTCCALYFNNRICILIFIIFFGGLECTFIERCRSHNLTTVSLFFLHSSDFHIKLLRSILFFAIEFLVTELLMLIVSMCSYELSLIETTLNIEFYLWRLFMCIY